jgi:hypothetical protein
MDYLPPSVMGRTRAWSHVSGEGAQLPRWQARPVPVAPLRHGNRDAHPLRSSRLRRCPQMGGPRERVGRRLWPARGALGALPGLVTRAAGLGGAGHVPGDGHHRQASTHGSAAAAPALPLAHPHPPPAFTSAAATTTPGTSPRPGWHSSATSCGCATARLTPCLRPCRPCTPLTFGASPLALHAAPRRRSSQAASRSWAAASAVRCAGAHALCRGHRAAHCAPCPAQVLARALGGRVGRNPHGAFVVGVERLELTRALAQRRDFARARVRTPPRPPRWCLSLLA